MISSIFSRLISWGIASLLGLGILAALIWYFGPMIRIGDLAPLVPVLNRVITIVVIFLLWLLVRVFKAWRNRRKSEQISNDLAAATDGAGDADREQSEEEMAEIRGRFEDALKTLKKSRVGGKRTRSIYQLPWYIIIGPPGSGKTTLLVNSGLQFPLAESIGQSKIQGVGGTRYCDWWFTDEAVLIDTAGRYTTQDSNREVDNRAWFGFLKLLKKHRRRRPINGIILAISVEELLRLSEVERERNAKAINDRIQELYEQLGVRFPIYLMLTKCDLMAGFMEFYGNLDRDDREQVWGFTFDLKDDALAAFDAQYDALQRQLEARLIKRLQDERDVQRRELIYNFPLQFSAARQGIQELLHQVFKTSRYRTTPLLRGVYMTSGTQEGTPFNRIMAQLASTFSLSRAATQSMPSKGKSFFIKDLMTKVIFGESGLAGANLKVERIYGWARRSGFALLIAIPILLNLLWWMSHSANVKLIGDVSAAADTIREDIKKVSPQDASLRGILPLMNEARALPVGYDAQSESVPITERWGLYQGARLGERGTIPAYDRILENAFLPRLMVEMEQDLRNNMNDTNRTYQTLKAYLMLALPDRMDTDYVRSYILEDWDKNLTRVLTTDQLDQLKEHLNALLKLQPLALPVPLDDNLVATARLMLSRTTLAERIYAVIKGDHINDGDPFTLANMAGRDGPRVFVRSSGAAINTGVPAFFSPQGYLNMYLPAESEAVKRVQDEAWIYATDAQGPAQIDQTSLTNSIRLAYLEDYTKHWIDFLEDIRILPFRDLPQAASILLVLSSDNSPLKELLLNVNNATSLAPDEVVGAPADGQSLRSRIESLFRSQSSSSQVVDPGIVDKSFAALHTLAGGGKDDKQPSPLDGLIQDIANLYVYVDQLSHSSGDELLTDMQNRAGTALTRVRQTGQRLPAPISDWVMSIVAQSDNLIAGDATGAIQAAWASDVAPFCRQALNGRYPFDPKSDQEVLIQDFGRFFAPGGILDGFFKQYLFPIVDTTARTWQLKPNFQKSINIKSSSLRYLQQAQQIQRAFFAGGGNMPAVTFELRPVRMDANTTNFMLSINGQTTNYSHGPIIGKTFNWPGQEGIGQVSFQFVPTPSSGRSGDSTVGPWAWFRMLDKSGLTPGSSSESFVTKFTLDDRWAEYEIRAASAFNPFDLGELRTFRCPDGL